MIKSKWISSPSLSLHFYMYPQFSLCLIMSLTADHYQLSIKTLCHASLLGLVVTPDCHAGWSLQTVTPVCHVCLSRLFVTPDCHARLSTKADTSVFHPQETKRKVTFIPTCMCMAHCVHELSRAHLYVCLRYCYHKT